MPAPAPVTVFETGTNRWRRVRRAGRPAGETRRLYLQPGGGSALRRARRRGRAPTEYVSDPAKPVPYAPRPQWGFDYDNPPVIAAWRRWLVEDQRFVDGRPDVATWVSEPLDGAAHDPRARSTARLFAETTGSDADWVVKLIDVFPDDAPGRFEMSGYQLMVSADIFRGRYRESLRGGRGRSRPTRCSTTSIPLPHANHTFRPGHRLMVQVQSSWFPLYDRNPQTFVPSIMTAPPEAYRAQRHRDPPRRGARDAPRAARGHGPRAALSPTR